MKTKRIEIATLAVAAIVGLALWGLRPHANEEAKGRSDTQTVSADVLDGEIGLAKTAGVDVGAEASGGELTPERLEALTTATAQIVRGDGSKLDVRSIDREFERLQVETNEVMNVRLVLKDFDAGRPILVEADHGGSLNRQLGPLVLQPASKDGAIEFQYAIGGHKGRYTLFVSQGDRQELLEFYAGKEPPTGQSGPPRFFNPKHS